MTRKDIDFSFKRHPLTGDLATKTGTNAIKQSIRNLILTNFYERGFNVNVAGNLNASMFENVGLITLQQIRDNISNAITNYEKDVQLLDVSVIDNDDNSIAVTIYYTEYNSEITQETTIELSRVR